MTIQQKISPRRLSLALLATTMIGCTSDEPRSVIDDASQDEIAEVQAMIDESASATKQSSADSSGKSSK